MYRALRAPVVALAGLLLSLALVSSLSLAGTRFYYCEAMGLTRSDPCEGLRESKGARDAAGAVRESHADCCEIVTLPSAPAGARAADGGVPPPPLVAILAPAAFVGGHCARESRARLPGFERWRPPPRPASEVRAQLMVFLT